jgi:hypothetical protein
MTLSAVQSSTSTSSFGAGTTTLRSSASMKPDLPLLSFALFMGWLHLTTHVVAYFVPLLWDGYATVEWTGNFTKLLAICVPVTIAVFFLLKAIGTVEYMLRKNDPQVMRLKPAAQ